MKQAKKRIWAGATCDQIVYNVSEAPLAVEVKKPRTRFETVEARQEFNRQISRRKHVRKFNGAFGPSSLYSTLTFDNEHEVHCFEDAKKIRDAYYRRLKRVYPEAKMAMYLGRGESTARIHMHMVTEGIPENVIIKKWGKGNIVRIEHLREQCFYNGVNCGQDYTGLANYLFDHWTEEQGGHRYKMSSNIEEPEEEPAKECKRKYSPDKPPTAPKGYIYIKCEYSRYGYMCFHYVKEPRKKRARRQE